MWDKEWNFAVKFGAQAQFKSRLDKIWSTGTVQVPSR